MYRRLPVLVSTVLSTPAGTPAVQTLQEVMLGLSPVALYPLTETSGTQATDVSANVLHGTYSNCTVNNVIGADGTAGCPLFVPASSSILSFPAGLNALFNTAEFSLVWFLRVRAASVWTDATLRQTFSLFADGNNVIRCRKFNSNNLLRFSYMAGATDRTVDYTSASDAWLMCTMTVSDAADQMKAYINDAQIGATQTTLGTFAGALSARTWGSAWDGWVSYIGIYTSILTLANVQAIYAAASPPN